MIRKTLYSVISVVSVASMILASACTASASSRLGAQTDAQNSAYQRMLKEKEESMSVWESDLFDESRFQLRFTPTASEKREAKQFARTLQTHLKEGNVYIHHLLSRLKDYNLPVELAAIPLMESGLNPNAKSSAGALGLWQYMRVTGKTLGLKRTQNYDEIYDFIEATEASLKYFKNMYSQLDNNWDLAVAAYNQGFYGVQRALNKAKASGVKHINYQTVPISRFARAYVHRFHAFVELMKHPDAYGIKLPEVQNRPAFQRVEVAGRVNSMKKAAELAGVSLATLRKLNAGYLSDRLNTRDNHGLLVPSDHVSRLEHALKSYTPDKTSTAKTVDTKKR